jgi:hypothetical protein
MSINRPFSKKPDAIDSRANDVLLSTCVGNVRLGFIHLITPRSEYTAAHASGESSAKRIALMTGEAVNTRSIAFTA